MTIGPAEPAPLDASPEQWWVEIEHRFGFLQTLGWGPTAAVVSPDARPALRALAAKLGELLTDLAGVAVAAPLFEAKVAAGLSLEMACEAYTVLLRRLLELRTRLPARPVADPIVAMAQDWPALPVLAGRASALCEECERLVASANAICDRPTILLLAGEVLGALRTVERMLSDLVGFGLEGTDVLAGMAARDARYDTFNETRDYAARAADYELAGSSSPELDALVGQLRTQRDELDAVETFARLVAAVDLSPPDLRGVCRIVGDEARHTLMGEIGLKMCGLDPFKVPVGTIGAELRRTLDPWDGLAQICLIGESGNQQAIDDAARLAERLGYGLLARMLDTIYQDERFHIVFGIRLLAKRHPRVSPSDLRQRALDITNEYLGAHGIAPVDMKDAGRLLGE